MWKKKSTTSWLKSRPLMLSATLCWMRKLFWTAPKKILPGVKKSANASGHLMLLGLWLHLGWNKRSFTSFSGTRKKPKRWGQQRRSARRMRNWNCYTEFMGRRTILGVKQGTGWTRAMESNWRCGERLRKEIHGISQSIWMACRWVTKWSVQNRKKTKGKGRGKKPLNNCVWSVF